MTNIAIITSLIYELTKLLNTATSQGRDITDEELDRATTNAQAARDRWYRR